MHGNENAHPAGQRGTGEEQTQTLSNTQYHGLSETARDFRAINRENLTDAAHDPWADLAASLLADAHTRSRLSEAYSAGSDIPVALRPPKPAKTARYSRAERYEATKHKNRWSAITANGRTLATRLLHLFQDDPSASQRLGSSPDPISAIHDTYGNKSQNKYLSGFYEIYTAGLLQIVDGKIVIHYDASKPDLGVPFVSIPIPHSIRAQVAARDGVSDCKVCGGAITDGKIDIDHIIAVSHGGTNHPSNLRIAHSFCNRSRRNGKAARP